MTYIKLPGFLLFIIFLIHPVQAQDQPDFFGAVRIGYSTFQEIDNEVYFADRATNEMQARIHLGLRWQATSQIRFTGRLAGRLSTRDEPLTFEMKSYTPGSGSIPRNTFIFDTLQLAWSPNENLTLTAGRMQPRFSLAGMIPKGFDRYFGANMSIGFSDGLWLNWRFNDNYRLHLIASYNSPDGSSHAARTPMDFSKSSSRVTGYAQIEHTDTDGLWAQRELSVSWNPSTLSHISSTGDYLAITTRWMMNLPFDISWTNLTAGGELGYAPTTPNRDIYSEDDDLRENGAFAWQISGYINNVLDRHTLGILYGEAEPGWLISSSFEPNVTMFEVRYQYIIASNISTEVRYRYRTPKQDGLSKNVRSRISDIYARVTFRF